MDRLISDEERIKRAEDVVERRRNADLKISSDNFSKDKSKNKLKIILYQILICLIIYCSIFYIKNSYNPKLQFVINNVNNILNYDVDFNKIYNFLSKKMDLVNEYVKNQSSLLQENTEAEDKKNNENDKNSEDEERLNTSVENTSDAEILGIGGACEEIVENVDKNISTEEQMELDANYIKSEFSLVKPINTYVVTSEFGTRESNDIVSADHKGIDLGASVGTEIFSALDGQVIEASNNGDYGTHLKVQTDNIVITYAHCSKLFVEQGDTVTKGVKIAEVGATGKATGPHLHFEVRVESRAVNPRLIMEF